MKARYFLPAATALWLSGCMISTVHTGPLQHDTRTIDRDASERLRVDLRMGAGELRVTGGASDWMRGDFNYNVPSWKPDIRYTSTGGHGTLAVEQPDTGHSNMGNAKYIWDLRLNNDIPTDVSVHFGAGEARLDLGSLSLRGVDVEMGVGELRLDLRGNPKRDFDVQVHGGVGEATVYLPSNVGLYAKAAGGIGGINVRGMQKEGDHWVNDAYTSAKVQIHVDVSGGVGAINLVAE
jgi:hypothetical protein